MPKVEKETLTEVEIKRSLVLLRITQELIRQCGEIEIFELRKVLKENIVEKIKKDTSPINVEKKEIATITPIRFTPIDLSPIKLPPIKQYIPLQEIPVQKQPEESVQGATKPLVQSKRKEIGEIKQLEKPQIKQSSPAFYIPQQLTVASLPQIKIPEPKLPPNFEYLRPVPTNEEINLKKLNALVKDNFVRSIECSGPNQNILVTGSMGRKPTAIQLSEQEIQDIFETFAIKANIPLSKGVFKIAFGNLILSAITSEVVGSKFIIKKMESSRPQPPIRR